MNAKNKVLRRHNRDICRLEAKEKEVSGEAKGALHI